MIELAKDNHIQVPGEAFYKISKSDLKYSMFETLDEFKSSILCSAFTSDESGCWACITDDGTKYHGRGVGYDVNYDDDTIEWTNKPEWATHVYWYGK